MTHPPSKMPTPTRPQPPQHQQQRPAAAVNHPAVAEYVTEWNKMAHQVDQLLQENKQLQYDLDVARNMIKELQHISDHERHEKEKYQRWAARFDTLTDEIAGLSAQLRDEARQAAMPAPEPEQIEHAPPQTPEQKVEDGIAAFAKKFAPPKQGNAGAT